MMNPRITAICMSTLHTVLMYLERDFLDQALAPPHWPLHQKSRDYQHRHGQNNGHGRNPAGAVVAHPV